MKKIAFFFLIIIVIISTFTYLYLVYLDNYNKSQKENKKYESYINQEITGTELTTLINKVVDSNIQNNVQKDKKGKYIDNEENSINIDIKFIDNDITYNIEKIYSSGTNKFFQYYGDIKFKCSITEYHKKTNKIRYMLFEQVTQ